MKSIQVAILALLAFMASGELIVLEDDFKRNYITQKNERGSVNDASNSVSTIIPPSSQSNESSSSQSNSPSSQSNESTSVPSNPSSPIIPPSSQSNESTSVPSNPSSPIIPPSKTSNITNTTNTINTTIIPPPKKPLAKNITFSNFTWTIRRNDVSQNPGPNIFGDSQRNVRIDDNKHLHLSIIKQENKWKSSGVYLKQPLGYGTYIWRVGKQFYKIDQSAVVGLFSYLNDSAQIDIELSKWGNIKKNNTQFVVQPHSISGNQHRYNTTYKDKDVIHLYKWQSDSIKFKSFYGDSIKSLNDQIDKYPSNKQDIIRQWTYKGDYIPKDKLKVVMNFWLYKANQTVDEKDQEIIIKEFKYIPLIQNNSNTSNQAVATYHLGWANFTQF